MSLEGYAVTHKAFGEGVILRATDRYITVRFAAAEKTFVYPDAFKGFMTIADAEAEKAVSADLQRSDEQHARETAQREEERRLQMRSGIVIPGGRPFSEREASYTPEPEETVE